MTRDYVSWFSSNLRRNMELLWFGHSGRPVVLFPTSMGRFYQNEDFGLVGSVADKIAVGEVQLVCVDSVDKESWYNKGAHPADRARRHDQYDQYIRREIVPYIQQRAGRGDLAAAGGPVSAPTTLPT